ncbi:sulfur transferase domain-containing protein [Metallibacterium sp.]|uniref:beta-lactamase hydrolase domain-containing protein n=1 Tax=Metallibacterium sp. TaxID=2940281 RepID=UPI002602D857|nr:sulfur transferase domain-containing protein [Metallibacterium sp.]
MTTGDIRFIEGRLYCMGQPDLEDLQALARKGVRRVINLRPHSELNWDEAACAATCGLDYINIPVATPADLDRTHATALREALQGDAHVLVHCATANRVGALLALVAAWDWGHSPESALELGWRAGLAALEPAVRMRLNLPLD